MDLNKRKMTNHLHSPAEFPSEPNVPYNPSTTPWEGIIISVLLLIIIRIIIKTSKTRLIVDVIPVIRTKIIE